MLNLERKTSLSEEDIKKKLRRFFGEAGLGLELKEETPQCLTYEGAGGYVTATLCSEAGKTRLDLVTQEWEYQVKEFAAGLPA
jgi:hypothetical protein